MLIDHNALARHGIDPAKAMVTLPRSRTTYSLALRKLLFQAGLKFELRCDEAGIPVPLDHFGQTGLENDWAPSNWAASSTRAKVLDEPGLAGHLSRIDGQHVPNDLPQSVPDFLVGPLFPRPVTDRRSSSPPPPARDRQPSESRDPRRPPAAW